MAKRKQQDTEPELKLCGDGEWCDGVAEFEGLCYDCYQDYLADQEAERNHYRKERDL
jgi:hypothetical protein